mmetsp:Transcript_4457/g.9940  ORF Transcript_4457/g.9940 Transcript_4457/m.9940 type:complete len:84 (+) Transcript_4457:1714-1965(+)
MSRKKKMARCLEWFEGSQVKQALKLDTKDCFLVLAAWSLDDPTGIQKRESDDPESRIIFLGRKDLTRLYTPTLINHLNLTWGD